MSEFKKTRDVSTYQKLSPPKSLQGEEDAEVTWDLIVKRYPNAAPLLCQMETVIERAEGLLHQLRSPHTHALERSSSFQIADSEDELMGPCNVDESAEVSIISDQDSRSAFVENMYQSPEIASLAARSLSEKISDDHQETGSPCEPDGSRSSQIFKNDASIGVEACSPDLSSSSINESNSKSPDLPELEIKESFGQEESIESCASFVVNVTKSPTPSKKLLEDREVGKSSSLEAWGKVVGENKTKTKYFKPVGSKGGSSSGTESVKEDSVSEHARRLSSLKSGPIQQITKLNFLGKKEELMQRFAGTIATASKVVDTTRQIEKNERVQEAVIHVDSVRDDIEDQVSKETVRIDSSKAEINERGERGINSSDKICKNVEESVKTIETSSESMKKHGTKPEIDLVKGNGDDGLSAPGAGPRSPVEILDEYSRICQVPVEYKNLSPSCSYNKSVIVKCCFGGFAFEACAQTRKVAKKEAAAKLLRCLAGRQIDGEITSGLTPLTRKQIEEIINLGNGGEHETAIRKLFKICMELNAPEPIYTVHQDSGIVGNRYTVKCGALGITTSGYGIRVLVAKRVAADVLLQAYNKNRNAAR